MSEADRPEVSSLARAIEELVDAKVAAAFAERETSPDDSPWLSLEAAAKYAYVSERTIARMVERCQLHTASIGRRRLVSRESLDAFLERQRGRK